jgi:hypothetical protein
MDTPDPAAPGTSLSRDAYRHVIFTLRNAMPAVPDTGRDPAEALAWRDHAAIAQVAGFCPANPAEAAMAAEFVAAHAQAMAVMQEAQDPNTPRDWIPRCRAQAACMMRLAQGAVRALMRMQAARERRAGEQAAADWAADHAVAMARAPSVTPDGKADPSHAEEHDPGKHDVETVVSRDAPATRAEAAPPAARREAPVSADAAAVEPGPVSPDAPQSAVASDVFSHASGPASGRVQAEPVAADAPRPAVEGNAFSHASRPASGGGQAGPVSPDAPRPAVASDALSNPSHSVPDSRDDKNARTSVTQAAPLQPGPRQTADARQTPLAA